jgi:Type II intron maturase
VASPVLSNIYLDRLDKFAETILIPEYTRGATRAANPAYARLTKAVSDAWRRGDRRAVRQLRARRRGAPRGNPRDPGYRRLRYIRYADDHLLGFTGPRAEAEQIKQRLAEFLRDDLKLELNQDKTLITHARTQAASFPGYQVTVQHSRHRPSVNGVVRLRVPRPVITAKCAPYLTHGKPERRAELMNLPDSVIISTYGAEYRGIVQYYLLASDVFRLNRLRWAAETSLLKTLAARHRSTVTAMARKYRATITTPHGPRACFQATVERPGRNPLVTRFGGIPLKRQKKAVITDRLPDLPTRRKELTIRLRTRRCEWCDTTADVEVHQVRKLADLARTGRPQPGWAQLMTRMRRKTLVVCTPCHQAIHHGLSIALTA